MDREAGLQDWPDRDLVVAYKGGVPEAYDEMYRRYNARIHGVCRRMLGNPEDAREAAQETFLKAYQALPRFNGQYKLGAWLSRIAANVCLDHLRRRTRSAMTTQLDENQESTDVELGPEDVVVRDVPALRALETIQPLHAEALKLRNLEGFSHKEIAAQLDMSPMQVKALLHRARVSFKRAWDNASGWALAPIIGMRSLLHHSSKDASSISAQLPAWTQTATPLLAERFAASAMVVVVALSGTGASTSGADGVNVSPSHVASTPFAGAERATALPAEASAPAALEPKEGLVAEVEGLLEEVRETAEEKSPEKKDKDTGDDDDGPDVGPGTAHGASQQIVRKVHDTTKDVEETIPNL